MNVFSADQLYKADAETIERQGISSFDLMERAANQLFQWLHQRLNGAQVPIRIFCGIGNNGGDGLALGRMLVQSGYNVTIYVANFSDNRSEDFLTNYDRFKDVSTEWPVLMSSVADFPEINKEDIVVDCLFGIGLNRPPGGWVKSLIQHLNETPSFKLSVDIPSGLSANEALMDPEAVIKANHTLTFQAPKLSFFLPDTGIYVPYFEVLDIGLDQDFLNGLKPLAQVVYQPLAQGIYRQREKFSHKGTFGHALVVGGSKGKMGAMVLSSKSSIKSGAGLVTAYVPENGNDILQISVPEVMCLSDSGKDHLIDFKFDLNPTVIVAGMGMGTEKGTLLGFENLLSKTERPMVLDADALNCISRVPKLKKLVPNNSILTPHEGELRRLVGDWKDDFEKIEKAKNLSKELQCIVVLKGAHTMVIQGDIMYINTTGNPGMATAGSGDVLSGILAGIMAQGYTSLEAAILGVYLHGSAGNLSAHEIGYESMTATNIIENLGKAYIGLFEQPNLSDTQAEGGDESEMKNNL